jgi:hypothetical protein
MHRVLVSLITVAFGFIVLGSPVDLKTKAKAETSAVIQAPGSRCTRLSFGPREKKKPKKETAAGTVTAMPGTRCLRLSAGGRPNTILPNTAPNIGLAASTAYIAKSANAQVNLKAIACDPEGDTVLYTYSTTGGRITGDGASAVWNLSGVTRPATYIVTVEVDDGCGCLSYDSTEVTLE